MLRPDTQTLWNILQAEKGLGGFILIGGTALSMHLNHRLSEDLDFAFDGPKLPRPRIEALKRRLGARGWRFAPNDPIAALQEFEDTGLDLHDYQQNHIVGERVKLTFVAPEHEVRVQLLAAAPDHVRVASLEEIFRLKCIACANRSKTRDWLDLYLLLRGGYFQPIDMRAPFAAAGVIQKFDIAMQRLCSGKPEAGDEGYESLLAKPPSVTQMRDYFLDIRNQIERAVARRAGSGDTSG